MEKLKLLFFALLFYLPFQIALNPAAGVDLASGRIFIVLLFLAWLAASLLAKKNKIAVNPQSLALLLFAAAGIFSLAAAENVFWGLRKIAFFASIFPLYFLAAEFVKTEKDFDGVSKAASAGLLIAAGFGIIQFFAQFIFGPDALKNFLSGFVAPLFWGAEFGSKVAENPSWFVNIGGETFFRAVSFFPDPHVFAVYLGLAVPLAVAGLPVRQAGLPVRQAGLSVRRAGVFSGGKIAKWRWAAVISGIAALFFTFSRGGYLGFFAALVFFAVFKIKNARKLNLRALAAGAAVLALIGVFLVFENPVAFRFYETFNFGEGSNFERIAIWKEALQIFKEHPVFGAGIGNYALEKNILSDYRDAANAHNLYLDLLAETGILGLSAWLFLIFYSLRLLHSGGGSGAAVLAAGLIWFSVHSFFETAVYSPAVLAMLMVYFGTAEIFNRRD